MNVTQRIEELKIVPVVVIERPEDARPMLGGLVKGGLPVAEITFRTACAEDAIKLACAEFPDMLAGAGTVINAGQCERAIAAGAKFIVSPGLSANVVRVCAERGVPYFPGVVTPTEIMAALELGLTDLKFFPASDFGGLKTIKALCSAFPAVRFMPTGGVNESNVLEFLGFKKIFAVGGTWMLKGDIAGIEQRTASAVELLGGQK